MGNDNVRVCTSIKGYVLYNAGQMWHWALEKPAAVLRAHESETLRTAYVYRLRDLVATYVSKHRLLQIGSEDGRINSSLTRFPASTFIEERSQRT